MLPNGQGKGVSPPLLKRAKTEEMTKSQNKWLERVQVAKAWDLESGKQLETRSSLPILPAQDRAWQMREGHQRLRCDGREMYCLHSYHLRLKVTTRKSKVALW